MSFHETNEEHASVIKTPRQLLITVILAFLIPITVIILLVNMVGSSIRTGAGSDGQTEEAIAKRIQPVAGFKLVDADAPMVFKTGEEVFESTCAACHSSGVAGAPKFEDKEAWAPFIEQGYDDLVKNAIHGIGAMPPRGGNDALSDFEVARAVVYMTNHSGADFAEPEAPSDADDADAGDDTGSQAAAATDDDAAEAPEAEAPEEAAAESEPEAADDKAPESQKKADAADADDDAAAEASDKADEAEEVASADSADNAVGEKLYQSVCITCHASGVAGAPKVGDAASWQPYVDTGMDSMLEKAISGVGAMPPRGGSQATDEELKAAIQYMVDASK